MTIWPKNWTPFCIQFNMFCVLLTVAAVGFGMKNEIAVSMILQYSIVKNIMFRNLDLYKIIMPNYYYTIWQITLVL